MEYKVYLSTINTCWGYLHPAYYQLEYRQDMFSQFALPKLSEQEIWMVSCQKGPTRHDRALWQDTLDILHYMEVI